MARLRGTAQFELSLRQTACNAARPGNQFFANAPELPVSRPGQLRPRGTIVPASARITARPRHGAALPCHDCRPGPIAHGRWLQPRPRGADRQAHASLDRLCAPDGRGARRRAGAACAPARQRRGRRQPPMQARSPSIATSSQRSRRSAPAALLERGRGRGRQARDFAPPARQRRARRDRDIRRRFPARAAGVEARHHRARHRRRRARC